MSNDDIIIRICETCKEPYPLNLENFPPHGKDKSGNQLFRIHCRECWRKLQRQYFGTEHGKAIKREVRKRRSDKVKIEKRRNVLKHPEAQKRRSKRFIEKRLKENPNYFKDKAKADVNAVARAKQWVIDNRERFNAAQRRRRQENPILKMKESVIRHKRRARMRQAEGSYTDGDVRRIYDEQEGRCAYCGISIYWHIPYDIHIDHIQPLARGGTNYPDNLACACASCNLEKGDKTISEWYATRGW